MGEEQLYRQSAVARGVEPADLVLRGGIVIDVLTGELRRADVAIVGELIAGVSPYAYRGRRILDCTDKFIAPGLIDTHIHIESSLLAPWEFARAVAACGTTTVIADPHEIANVCGLEGVRFMLKAARGQPCEILLTVPSCVPTTPLETSGANLGVEEIARMLRWPQVVGLGEMMNYPGVLRGETKVLAKLKVAAGHPIDGHAPGLAGDDLQAYVGAGPDSDHECVSLEEAREKLRAGMWIMIREGPAARNLCDLLPLVKESAAASRCMFVSDDLAPHELDEHGHLERLLRQATAQGLDPIAALRLVTVNPAARFRLQDRGIVRPGLLADLVIFDNLDDFRVEMTLRHGIPINEYPATKPRGRVPTNTCHLPPLPADVFAVPASAGVVRIIGVVARQIVTKALRLQLPIRNGCLSPDPAREIAKIAVVERHGKNGGIGIGFVHGLRLKRGALASTVAHDSHNLIVVGVDDQLMLIAAQKIAQEGGGLCAVTPEGQAAIVPLPIAGLMSDRPLAEVVSSLRCLLEVTRNLGCGNSNPFEVLSFLALPIIPELRLTDKGLVDVNLFKHVPLVGD
ncbi:MAG: adenine deaminase [Candidatus Zipacnadales bacterium]